MTSVYESDCSNVHRGVHTLSQRSTRRYEATRTAVAEFLGGIDPQEVIFTSGTTAGINLVARSYGSKLVKEGDEVLVSQLEHHANLLPWIQLCSAVNATLRILPINSDGEVALEQIDEYLSPKTKIVAISHVSNSLGTLVDISQIVQKAHSVGAKVLIDGAQAVPHFPVNVSELGADFYAFSGHKLYGPFGTGILWGQKACLEEMEPLMWGGDMVNGVSFEYGIDLAEIPHRFEAGTPNVVGMIGLGSAINWMKSIGYDVIRDHEEHLMNFALEQISNLPGVRLLGPKSSRVGAISFTIEGVHPHDAGTLLDGAGVAIRTGHHCAEPAMEALGVSASIRASLGLYNSRDDIERLILGIKEVQKIMGKS